MKKILYISPHLDDVVLSCGSTIEKQCSEGYSVSVATLFSAGSSNSNHIIRRKNDIEALLVLGASHIHMGFTDAPFRSKIYNSFSSLLFHHKPSTETKLLNNIILDIRNIIEAGNYNLCYFPLGVGGHIDHNLAFQAGLKLLDTNISNCLFYEDMPYNSVQNWSNIRKHQCGIQYLSSEIIYTKLKNQNIYFINNYLVSPEDVILSENKYKHEYKCLNNVILKPIFNAIELKKEMYNTHKLKALRKYETEFDFLFSNKKSKCTESEVFYELICNN